MFPNKENHLIMTYDEFRTYMVESVSKIFAGKYEVVAEMSKRPGVEPYEIINIKEKIGAGSYENGFRLEECYDEYIEGKPLGEIILERVKDTEGVDEWFKKINFEQLNDFEKFKDRLIIRPIRLVTNRKILNDHMYRPMGDIALVLYMLLHNESDGMATAKVRKETIEAWNLPDDYLFNHAMNNTAKLFEPFICPMEHIMMGQKPETYPDKNKFFLRPDYSHNISQIGTYSMFINNSLNAAGALFYPGVVQKLSEVLQGDFYAAIPYMSYVAIHVKGSLPLADIRDMVKRMKHSPLENPSEFLTDNVYLYSRKNDILKML